MGGMGQPPLGGAEVGTGLLAGGAGLLAGDLGTAFGALATVEVDVMTRDDPSTSDGGGGGGGSILWLSPFFGPLAVF